MGASFDPWFKVWCCISLCLCVIAPLCSGSDRISAKQSISGDQTIVSKPGGLFELGFFDPSGKSSKYYIGIWYKKVSVQTIVWVANRESPISDKHSYEFRILNGNLVLAKANSNSKPVWSTDLSNTTSGSIEAVLHDTGNLVVSDEPNTNQQPLWQSFDHPAHTWLPGGKVIYNKRTNKPQRLISWKNKDDPAPGLFSLELDPFNKQYVIKWNKTRQYWTSGPWNAQEQIFSLVPEMRLSYNYNFSYVDNKDESYFTYDVYHTSVLSRFVMDISGQVKQLTWLDSSQEWNLFWSNPKQQCQVYAYCGAFGSCNQNSLFCNCLKGFSPKSESDWGLNDYSGGCKRNTPLQCLSPSSQKKGDEFFMYSDVDLPQNGRPVNAATIEECKSACLRNCSCKGYAYDSNKCSVWYEDMLNIQELFDGDNSGKTLYLKLAASEFPKKSNKKLIIGLVVGSVIIIVVLLCLVFAVFFRRRKQSLGSRKGVEGSLISFSYRELQTATKNFSEKLGGGGFGSVFKGTLPDSSVIGVKKLESFSQGEKQFRTEVSTIGTIQHVNLVRLRGFCSDGAKKLLVYDYMPNGSLDSHLFPANSSKLLDWKTRYQIALGIARGLAYLHEKCRDCIIHCDIKPENILLDVDFCPKVADFGLAKLVGRDFSRVLTTMRGTRGYLAPEWISGVAITAKADVFSYGMMLFELISGHRNTEQSVDGTVKFFPTWASSKVAEGAEIMSIVDPRLEGNADEQEVLKICKLACWCIQDNEVQRPSMGQVVQILEGVMDVNMPPIPRSLQVFVENQSDIMFYTESSSSTQSSQTQNTSLAASSVTKSSSSTVSNKSLGPLANG